MTQAELAEKVGCSTAHISDIECGKINMGISTFIRIMEELDLSADWVIGANTSHSSLKLNNELELQLEGCTAAELAIILETIKNLKKSLFAARRKEY